MTKFTRFATNLQKLFDPICVGCGNSNQNGLNVAAFVGSSLMSGLMRNLTAIAVAASLCSVPMAAIASSPTVPAAPVGAAPVAAAPASPWLALSAMTTSSSAASAAVAAQDYNDDGPGFPPWPALAVILATIAVGIYILVSDDDGHVHLPLPEPVSPA
jgi:hypothetical protein